MKQADRPIRRNAPLARRWVGAAAAVLLAAASADAAEVTVVLSSDAAPYRQAQAAIAARLGELGHTARTVMLADLQKRPAPPSGACLAVGSTAGAWLTAKLPPAAALGYCLVADPAAAGLTRRPRTTGVGTTVALADQFRLIAAALPAARAVGMLYRGEAPRSAALRKAARTALPAGWRLEAVDVDKHRTPAAAIEALLARRIDIVWTAPDTSIYSVATLRALLLAAIRARKPVFGFSPALVRAGGLIGVGIDPAAQGRRAADLLGRLLAGPPPPQTTPAGGDPARHAAPAFRVAVNLIVAKQLGITLPQALLERAGWVYRQKGGSQR